MSNETLADRLAVCSWSLQPRDPDDLAAKLQAGGIRRIQFALDPLREAPAIWRRTETVFRENNISVVSGMFVCLGEDYTTLETIHRTGGIIPDATWEQNRRNFRQIVALAAGMGLKLVTFHAGTVPSAESDPIYAKLLRRLGEVVEMFAASGLSLALETGPETASVLAGFLRKLDRPNLSVNFDPANFILYGQGDPIEAVRVLAPRIRQVHIKDAKHPKAAGNWGEETPAGLGDVDWPAFFNALRQINFTGDFVIEREAGTQRIRDVVAAREIVENTFI